MQKESFLNFINGFAAVVQNEIVKLADKNMSNEDKKKQLDVKMFEYVQKVLTTQKLNIFVKLLIKKLIVPCLDDVTQLIYDLLKAKIKGVTPEDKKEDNSGNDKKDDNASQAQDNSNKKNNSNKNS